jgi:hypothetical protein
MCVLGKEEIMESPKFRIILFSLSCIFAVGVTLTGCGGSGGGGDDGSTSVEPQPPLAIDVTNAMQATAAVLDATVLVVDVGGPGGPIGVVVDQESTQVDLLKVIRAQVNKFPVLTEQTAQLTGVVLPYEPFDCNVSGTVTFSGEIASPDSSSLTPGDTITIAATNCDDGDGLVLNGTMTLVVVTATGMIDQDPYSVNLFLPPYDFTFDVTMGNFSIKETATGSAATINGDLTWQEDSDDGVIINSMYSGNSLQLTSPDTTDILTKYQITSTIDQGNNDAYTTVNAGSLSSTKLGGSVDFQTTTPFTGYNSDFPDTGQIVITGATVTDGVGFSKVTAVSENSTCVRLVVDPNGDGLTSEIITTWESLPTGVPVDCPI